MSLPTCETVPDDEANLPPARRRRGKRLIIPLDADDRARFLDELAQRTIPSFDFFLFSALAGLVIVAAILVDSPAFFLLAALLSPFMAPAIGLSLATILGSGRLFLLTLAGTLLGSLVVFLVGALAGWVLRGLPPLPLNQAVLHTQLTWPDFAILSLGVVLVVYMLVRTEQKPLVPGIILAYELYIPIGLAGFGLVSGAAHLWPDGLLVFLVHFTWAVLLGTVTLAFLGFRPLTLFGYTLGTTIALAGLVLALGLSGIGTAFQAQVALPTLTPSLTSTITLTEPPTPSPTMVITPSPTDTLTPTNTLVPSLTPTITLTPAPTPIWAIINSETGANIRTEPKTNAAVAAVVDNRALVEVLPDTSQEGTVIWVHIRYNGIEGWIWQSLLITATPAPGW
jgi:uncharacterized membrane protein